MGTQKPNNFLEAQRSALLLVSKTELTRQSNRNILMRGGCLCIVHTAALRMSQRKVTAVNVGNR